jgi:Sulfotransferase family
VTFAGEVREDAEVSSTSTPEPGVVLRSVDATPEDAWGFVVVVTYGRSGSTLVQGLLNALPRTLCRGENGMYPLHLFRACEHAVAFAEKHLTGHRNWKRIGRRSQSAFYGAHLLRMSRFVNSSRTLMNELLIGPMNPDNLDRIGFKEVRWHEIRPAETEAFFTWLEACYPEVRYVLNTRDVADAVSSGFWRRRPKDKAERDISRVMEVQQHLRETRPERVFDLRYEDVTGDDAEASTRQLTGLAEFVTGSCDDEVLAAMRATLEVGHGPYPFGRSKPVPDDDPTGAGTVPEEQAE